MWRLLVVGVVLAGCRLGFDDTTVPGGDDVVDRDCGIPHELGSRGVIDPASVRIYNETIMSGTITQLSGTLDTDLSLRVQLWDGYGAFAGGRAALGTYPIAGADASAATCGVCAYVQRKISDSRYTTTLAIDGTVAVTKLGSSGTEAMVTVTALELAEVDTSTSTLIPGGCHVLLDDATLTGTASSSSGDVSRGGHGGDGAGSGGDGD